MSDNTPSIPSPQGAGGLDWGKVFEDQANDPGSKALPAGPQNAFVKDAKVKPASTGNQMINVTFEVEDGPYKTRWLWTNIVFVPDNTRAMRYTLKKLRALGVDPAWLQATNPPLAQVAQQIVGARAVIDVTQRTYNDELTNDVDSWRANEAGPSAQPVGAGPVPQPGPAAAPAPTPQPNVPQPIGANPPVAGPGAPPVPNPAEAAPRAEPPAGEPF